MGANNSREIADADAAKDSLFTSIFVFQGAVIVLLSLVLLLQLLRPFYTIIPDPNQERGEGILKSVLIKVVNPRRQSTSTPSTTSPIWTPESTVIDESPHAERRRRDSWTRRNNDEGVYVLEVEGGPNTDKT